MTSIFIFISGATLLVYSAERLIGSLVGVSRGLRISVFLLAIIFTGIEFDDIVLGVALNLEDEQDVALGLVLGTAVSFTGIVLALGAILTPTRFDIPREYIVDLRGRSAHHGRVRPAGGGHRPRTPSCCSLLFVAWIAYVAYRETRRETATFRNLEIVEELERGRRGRRRPGASAGHLDDEPVRRRSAASRAGSTSAWPCWRSAGSSSAPPPSARAPSRSSTATASKAPCSAPPIVTAVLCIEDLFLTVQPIRKGVPEIGIGNVIGSLVFSVTGKLGIVVLAGGTIAIGSNVLRWHLPVLVGHDRARRLLPVHRATQALARLRAARALRRLLDRQLRRLRRRARRGLTTAMQPNEITEILDRPIAQELWPAT